MIFEPWIEKRKTFRTTTLFLIWGILFLNLVCTNCIKIDHVSTILIQIEPAACHFIYIHCICDHHASVNLFCWITTDQKTFRISVKAFEVTAFDTIPSFTELERQSLTVSSWTIRKSNNDIGSSGTWQVNTGSRSVV